MNQSSGRKTLSTESSTLRSQLQIAIHCAAEGLTQKGMGYLFFLFRSYDVSGHFFACPFLPPLFYGMVTNHQQFSMVPFIVAWQCTVLSWQCTY